MVTAGLYYLVGSYKLLLEFAILSLAATPYLLVQTRVALLVRLVVLSAALVSVPHEPVLVSLSF